MLDSKLKDWLNKYVIVLDNAPIYTGAIIKNYLYNYNLPVLFTGVASFNAIPAELVFAIMKNRFLTVMKEWSEARGETWLKIKELVKLIDFVGSTVKPE